MVSCWVRTQQLQGGNQLGGDFKERGWLTVPCLEAGARRCCTSTWVKRVGSMVALYRYSQRAIPATLSYVQRYLLNPRY